VLVYERGDFFREHCDTEKVPGMFATLVIVLPAEHEGGELVIRHEGREVTVDLSGPDLGLARWAAFYTDCQHEIMPLRSGHRVALIYNLVRPSASGRPGRTRP
jgi:predicted 2-oxoglutarate/Fe(II)-dependent dioxygenase YbiX